MDQKKQVLQWLEEHAGEMQQLLSSLIQIPSYSGEEYNVQQAVKAAMEAVGLDVTVRAFDEAGVRPNVLGTLQGTGGGKSLLMDAHSDTVPVRAPEKWEHGPFSGDFDGTWIHGRGAGDDKWGIAAGIFTLRALKECGVPLRGDVQLLSSVGEEKGKDDRMNRGAGAMVRSLEKKADFCIVCEGSNMEICPETPYTLAFSVRIVGKATHTCLRRNCIYPQPHNVWSGTKEGVDALQKALPIIDGLFRLERELSIEHDRGGLLGAGGTDLLNKQGVGAFTICPVEIVGGSGNAVMGEVNLRYSVHFPSVYTHEEVFDYITQCIQGIASGDLWLRKHPPEITLLGQNTGFSSDAGHPGVAAMQQACADALGKKGVVASWIAGCDGDSINPYIPCVVFGPQPPNTHAPNERITLWETLQCAKVFAMTAMEYCK